MAWSEVFHLSLFDVVVFLIAAASACGVILRLHLDEFQGPVREGERQRHLLRLFRHAPLVGVFAAPRILAPVQHRHGRFDLENKIYFFQQMLLKPA